jgi:hypothetical protein
MRVKVAKEAMSSDETLGGKTRRKVAYLDMTVLVQTKGPYTAQHEPRGPISSAVEY